MGVSNVEPRRIVSAHPWEIRADGTSPRMLLHAPGEIELPVPAGARTLTGDFGIERGAYTGDGRTDGAEFVVEAITTDGRATALWRDTLSPLSNPSDRGRRHFRVELPSAPVTGVRILTRPGAAADNSWDWTYLADLRIDNQPATSTRPGTAIP
jgi:hypothetical protein